MKKALFIHFLLCSHLLLSVAQPSSGQPNFKIRATGTGNTTGHVASLSIQNKSDAPLPVAPQQAYIPSGGQYQPYIVFIPAVTIAPNSTQTVPVNGYCADVHTPPVPEGIEMPPLDTWIPVGPAPPGSGIPVLPQPPLDPFDPSDISDIIVGPEFTHIPTQKPTPSSGEPADSKPKDTGNPPVPTRPPVNEPGREVPGTPIGPTWPGTEKPVGGTLRPGSKPVHFPPVVVAALNNIIQAYEAGKDRGVINTPFSGNPEKEREAVIQQTFWIYTAALTGEPYEREHFEDRVITQFEKATNQTVATLPVADKKNLEDGVTAFWNTFVATGVEAKVLRAPEGSTTGNVPVQTTPGEEAEPSTEEPRDKNCICDTISVQVTVTHEFEGRTITDVEETATLTGNAETLSGTVTDVTNQQELTISLSGFDVKCNCSDGSVDCQDYGSRNEKGELGNINEVKIRTTNAGNCEVVEAPTKSAKSSFSFKIKSKPPGKDDPGGVTLDVIITAHCKSADCNPGRSDKCEKTLTIQLTKADD